MAANNPQSKKRRRDPLGLVPRPGEPPAPAPTTPVRNPRPPSEKAAAFDAAYQRWLAAKRADEAKAAAKAEAAASKPRKCRECLRTKPPTAFPNERGSRCNCCGGQSRGKSVRTVSGGSPGLGKRA